jgi:16S rRNA (cytidine1402-2'-O)-methyltransferase
MTNFFVVATPIGNLEDITLRALRVLKEVDFILCEDTRNTQTILNKYEIKTKTISYHQHSKDSKKNKIFDLINEGKNLALVSDAGTPGVSDPGGLLVSQIREEFGDEVKIIPIPGASALTAALSVSGLSFREFTFLGFLPHKKGRETIFKEIRESERIYVFYESPHRLLKSLEAMQGFENKKIIVIREITKVFEETVVGKPEEVLEFFKNKTKILGEFVVIVDSNK